MNVTFKTHFKKTQTDNLDLKNNKFKSINSLMIILVFYLDLFILSDEHILRHAKFLCTVIKEG